MAKKCFIGISKKNETIVTRIPPELGADLDVFRRTLPLDKG